MDYSRPVTDKRPEYKRQPQKIAINVAMTPIQLKILEREARLMQITVPGVVRNVLNQFYRKEIMELEGIQG